MTKSSSLHYLISNTNCNVQWCTNCVLVADGSLSRWWSLHHWEPASHCAKLCGIKVLLISFLTAVIAKVITWWKNCLIHFELYHISHLNCGYFAIMFWFKNLNCNCILWLSIWNFRSQFSTQVKDIYEKLQGGL